MAPLRYEHWFEDCDEHEACILHVGEGENEQGAFRTESHLHSDIDPAFRLNLDYPDADDRRKGAAKDDRVRWALADDAAIAHPEFPWDDAERRRIAAVAAVKGLGSLDELALAAKTDPAVLVDEAAAKRWVEPHEVQALRADAAVVSSLAAVEARRDILRAVVDPKRATPPAEDVLQAQAFLALAELDGVKAALEVAGEVIAVAEVGGAVLPAKP